MKNSDNKAKNGRYKDPEKRKAYMKKYRQEMKQSDQIGDDKTANVNDLNASNIEDLEAVEYPTEDLNE